MSWSSLLCTVFLGVSSSTPPTLQGSVHVSCADGQAFCDVTGTPSGEIRVCFEDSFSELDSVHLSERHSDMRRRSNFCDLYVLSTEEQTADSEQCITNYDDYDAKYFKVGELRFRRYEVQSADAQPLGVLWVTSEKQYAWPDWRLLAMRARAHETSTQSWSIYAQDVPYRIYRPRVWVIEGWNVATVSSCRERAGQPCHSAAIDVVEDGNDGLLLGALMSLHMKTFR